MQLPGAGQRLRFLAPAPYLCIGALWHRARTQQWSAQRARGGRVRWLWPDLCRAGEARGMASQAWRLWGGAAAMAAMGARGVRRRQKQGRCHQGLCGAGASRGALPQQGSGWVLLLTGRGGAT